ncbi:phospho-N-acetylmuramoyl-pentapeptide-transferase [Lyngbya aestuarii BL J]|uniref:Phospho-N-acetylmuramoyl-pentapeptide-transferase n=1 Tax=Lyngbya aestuarii BL J TaxID=1348334 RepID=U7QGD0_9CYAN|nr:phospho-N-acetylmuramoyl-pentapeptide-transferase [Lyngbya aestuarii]ERT06140.1 phospho-N-acetylmuramoyl-pentapeptide-transferase [Lyngbya aestuarii BL J]
MDSLFSPIRSSNLSGRHLWALLTLGLSALAISLDITADRFLNPQTSLFFPLVVCGLITAALGHWVIPLLVRIKAGQFIREDGPQAHLKKAGTPTMGGIFFIPVGVVGGLIWSGFDPNVIAISTLTLAYGFIGWLDDWQILRRKSNQGISPQMKLALQVGLATLFCLALATRGVGSLSLQSSEISTVALPFGLALPLGWLFWPLAVFVPVAESNATNLTDGVDGLMGGLGAITLFGLGAYLAPTSPELMVFCACLSGSCLGFVSHNRNPAKVFMGDTGSLALGGALAAVALLSNTLWMLLIISGIFLVETVSVIAQVSYYKATKNPDGIGKRLFRMAPLHHHLELCGWSETQVVGTFYLINVILVLVSLVIA